MKYYYLIGYDMDYAVCFSSKKAMARYAADNNLYKWYYVVNKKEIPKNLYYVFGNGICKDYKIKQNEIIMKDSLKDRRK